MMGFAAALGKLWGSCGAKDRTSVNTTPRKQVPEAGAALPGDSHYTHKDTIFLVCAA